MYREGSDSGEGGRGEVKVSIVESGEDEAGVVRARVGQDG